MKKHYTSADTVEYHFPQSSEFYATEEEIILTLPTAMSETFMTLQKTIAESDEFNTLEAAALHDAIEASFDTLHVSRYFRMQMDRKVG